MTWSPTICIDRCVCQRMLFAELLPLARAGDWDVARIGTETGCGDQCGICRPYLHAMLVTGTVQFDRVLLEDDCETEAA